MNVLLSHSFQCKQISLIQPDSGGWLVYSKAACSKTRLLAMERKELISDCFTLASEIRCMILKVKVYWSKSMQHLSQFVWLPLLTTSYHITACITADSIAPPPPLQKVIWLVTPYHLHSLFQVNLFRLQKLLYMKQTKRWHTKIILAWIYTRMIDHSQVNFNRDMMVWQFWSWNLNPKSAMALLTLQFHRPNHWCHTHAYWQGLDSNMKLPIR